MTLPTLDDPTSPDERLYGVSSTSESDPFRTNPASYMDFRIFICACIVAAGFLPIAGCDRPTDRLDAGANTSGRLSGESGIDVWYGPDQRVGHLGRAQSDFNVMGAVSDPGSVAEMYYRLNGGEAEKLSIGNEENRRLVGSGDFNADIPIDLLEPGSNVVELVAVDTAGVEESVEVNVTLEEESSYPLPVDIDWSEVEDLQNVGQIVDGKWGITDEGLRTLEPGYDRIFLIGDTTWQDYEVTVPITIHWVEGRPRSGVGILMRFTGHIVGGHRDFPPSQPKWGYQPFGGIGWLRWMNGGDHPPPVRQFFRGDDDVMENFGPADVALGQTYWMKMRAETLKDSEEGHGVTRYSWKMWEDGTTEPAEWDWEVDQESEHALRSGGAVLLAHRLDATFGDLSIEAVAP